MANKPIKKPLEKTVLFNENTLKGLIGNGENAAEPFLIQLSGRETGQHYNLSQGNLKIGRDASCEICIDDPHVSRVHAAVATHNGQTIIRDMESTNGIFVNGNRVKEHTLSDGDKVLVGTRLYFRFAYQDAQDQNYQQNLFRAANMDELTQLYNKKYFLDALPKEMSFVRRGNMPLSLMMLDIDHFKQINDTYGHLAGDEVLKHLGQHLNKHVRMENISCRYGGEEFAIILKNCTSETGFAVAERLRTAIEAEAIEFREQKIPITISIGIATFVDDCFNTMEDFIQQADEYLYEAKRTGRNKTVTIKHRPKATP